MINENILFEDNKKGDVLKEEFITLIKENFSSEDVVLIKEAVDLSEEVHKDQEQYDKRPYFEHPLEVASIIINKFKINNNKDLIISALLHDSLEDQSEKLFASHMEDNDFFIKNFDALNLDVFTKKTDTVVKKLAFFYLKEKFGKLVAKRISYLSKPDFNSLILKFSGKKFSDENKEKLKNEKYKEYFHGLLGVKDSGVLIIKCADLLNNISKNRFLEDEKQKKKFIKKYFPVVRDVVIPFLQNIDENHPLFDKKEIILNYFKEEIALGNFEENYNNIY